jgi:microsomal dipeptidase-like Zn-dependent dipeptidase
MDCDRYRQLFIADAHSDTLLHRDPSAASTRGHVDLPRLLDGGVDLQVYALAPFAPAMRDTEGDICGSRAARNRIALLFFLKEPFRPRTWFDSEARVLRMIERFNAAVGKGPDKEARLTALFEREDLDWLLNAQSNNESAVGAMLAIEGFYWASRDEAILRQQIRDMRDRGVRMIGMTGPASNHLAGSSEDCDDKGGLSDLGRVAVREFWRRGMILDLAHASRAVIADVAAMAQEPEGVGPVVVSHVCIRRTCDRDRNLSDEDTRNIVRAGGVIGLGYWNHVACWTPAESSREVRRKIVASFLGLHEILSDPAFRQEMGPGFDPLDHIALGSGFDGATTMPFDTTGVPWLLEGLADAERDGRPIFNEAAIAKIAGRNLLRVINQALVRD